MPIEPGAQETFGPFQAVRRLGDGATAAVFLAQRTDFAQRVAIKLFHRDTMLEGMGLSPAGEDEVLARLDHPHIVRWVDRGRLQDGRRYMAMEFVDGVSLDAFCDVHRLALPDRIEFLLQGLHALEHAHGRLIIHGDLKPGNILATEQGGVKLLDFGAARSFGEAASSGAHTPMFASPEQRHGERLTLGSDLYSFGLIARLLLAGIAPTTSATELPSAALAGQPQAAAREIAQARGTGLSKLLSNLRGDLDAILRKALQADPEDRYLSADHFSADLRNYLSGRPVLARRNSRVERTRKWVGRHGLAATISAVLVAAMVLSIGGVLWKSAQANHQRNVAQERLHDLVGLTGTLEGELYDSTKMLPHSDAARDSLLSGATETLGNLSVADSKDPAFAVELAGQYEKLARLQLQQASPVAGAKASGDIAQGTKLLDTVPRSSRSFAAAQTERGRLEALRQPVQP